VFILDTNILSAMMRLLLEPEVAAWIAAQPVELLFTTSLSQAEILSGLAVMPDGRRRRDLEAAARVMFVEDFDGRVLPFDMKAAAAYAGIFAARRKAGRPASTIDLMIASIARSHGASVVTCDVSGFEDCGIPLINPWDAP
jgi:predicted nucleic acid-binding protein